MKIIPREEIERQQNLRVAYTNALNSVLKMIEEGKSGTELETAKSNAVKAGSEIGVKEIDFEKEYKRYQTRKSRQEKTNK